MKLTVNWLRKYLKLDSSIDGIVETLNNIGLEVESVVDNSKIYSSFLIAEILETTRHPNAEKLQVCKVNNGKEVIQVVCGASNARPGIKVVLAPVGTVIPCNKMVIKHSTIRGIESNGMLCSASELSINGDSEGIIEIKNAIVGTAFADHYGLNDIILEISLTPNRGDCASVRGIARDLAATGIPSNNNVIPENNIIGSGKSNHVEIQDTDGCLAYHYRYVSNINNKNHVDIAGMSWLESTGYTAKSKLVDISNFIMLDIGNPNHIYDTDKINGKIVIRKSVLGEAFQAIGGKDYILPHGLTVIADDEKVLSIAGVIGSELSKVDKETTNILIEIANFNAEAVMRAGRELNISTDSRFRFERHIDHESLREAMTYISYMIHQSCGGDFSEVTYLNNGQLITSKILKFNHESIKRISGIDIDNDIVWNILNKLGFENTNEGVKVPSWRLNDISSEPDLVEEILRINGFSKVPEVPIEFDSSEIIPLPKSKNSLARDLLLNRGLNEVVSWSFTSSSYASEFAYIEDIIFIMNPISLDMEVMRPSIFCSFIPIIHSNISRGFHNLSLFEIGPVYKKSIETNQSNVITGVRIGNANEKGVHSNGREYDFFDVKDDVLSILSELSGDVGKYSITREAPEYYHPGRSCAFKLGKKTIAYCGALHPRIIKKLDILSDNVMLFEVFLDELVIKKTSKAQFYHYDYQVINRDFAFIVKNDLDSALLIKSINSLKIEVIESVEIFDVYAGKGIEEGFKSIALTIKIQPKDGTFTDEKIAAIEKAVIEKILKDYDGILRK